MSTDIRYSSPAIALHWIVALMLFGLVGLGFYMSGLSLSPFKLKLYSWHKWAGVTVFLLVLLRLLWRLLSPPPALPAGMSRPMQWLAHGGHLALYGLMFLIPLSGWLMSSAMGFQTVWFGVLPLPDLVSRNKELAAMLQNAHLMLNIAMLVLVAGHVLAALHHQFGRKDGLLYRMLPLPSLKSAGH